MDKLTTLRQRLSRISPAHDYPVGLMHPYWARKPFNVISEIIACLTEPGERVADPFMGSGTVLFSALAQEREVLGSDLNPLAVFIVSTLLDLGTPGIDHRAEARRFLDEFSSLVLEWYRLPGSEQYLERERFTVEGTFEEGEFSLVRTELSLQGRPTHFRN